MTSEHIGLAWQFHVNPKSCDNPLYYEQYIQLCAISDAKTGNAITHLLIDQEADKLAGYISLRATSLVSEDGNGIGIVHPAMEIAELAVDTDYERKGIGTELIDSAVLFTDDIRTNVAGMRYIVTCADPQAVSFYQHQGFSPVSDLYEVLRDGWNVHCVPMYIELPEIQ